MSQDDGKLSTTALAKKLDIPTQQLFATFKEYGWIQRTGESWALTPKGEFEGGAYQHSRRFGRYIVWPQILDHHPLLAAIESNKRITAASMRRYYPSLHARHVNRALAELGLQRHSILGWELTERGKALGGKQEESEASGAFYVTWPHEIVDNVVVHRELTRQSDQAPSTANNTENSGDETSGELDLFTATTEPQECLGVDGHRLQTPLQMSVCNWLYLSQLAHAFQRALPTEELVYADFYIPKRHIYIDCWEADVPAQALSAKLHKRELYRQLKLDSIEINAADVHRLDEVLGRGLLAFGIRS